MKLLKKLSKFNTIKIMAIAIQLAPILNLSILH